MQMNKEYASKGVAGAGLGTGIATTPQSTYNPLPACTCNCGNN